MAYLQRFASALAAPVIAPAFITLPAFGALAAFATPPKAAPFIAPESALLSEVAFMTK